MLSLCYEYLSSIFFRLSPLCIGRAMEQVRLHGFTVSTGSMGFIGSIFRASRQCDAHLSMFVCPCLLIHGIALLIGYAYRTMSTRPTEPYRQTRGEIGCLYSGLDFCSRRSFVSPHRPIASFLLPLTFYICKYEQPPLAFLCTPNAKSGCLSICKHAKRRDGVRVAAAAFA